MWPNDETIWSYDLTKIKFWIIKRLIAFEISCGDVDSLVIFVILNWKYYTLLHGLRFDYIIHLHLPSIYLKPRDHKSANHGLALRKRETVEEGTKLVCLGSKGNFLNLSMRNRTKTEYFLFPRVMSLQFYHINPR